MAQPKAPPTLRTLRQFSERHSAFSLHHLRWLRARVPQYAPAFLMVGGRLFVWEERFFELVHEQNRDAA